MNDVEPDRHSCAMTIVQHAVRHGHPFPPSDRNAEELCTGARAPVQPGGDLSCANCGVVRVAGPVLRRVTRGQQAPRG